MPNSLKKIVAVFVLIAVLPVCYVAYELSSVSDNEEIINKIYQNQLDAILFSVNQYSADIVTSWANRISSVASSSDMSDIQQYEEFYNILSQFSTLRFAYLSDQKGNTVLVSADSLLEQKSVEEHLNKIVLSNGDVIDRLIQYNKAGYRRMEVLDSASIDNLLPIMFATDSVFNGYTIAIMLVEPRSLITKDLGPRMQTIAANQFIISARRLQDDSLIYATELTGGDNVINEQHRENWQHRDFWLLPKYYLGISLKGATISELVKERSHNNMIILGIILFVLLGGMVFLFKNIKKEIYLSNAKSEFVSNVSHEIRTPLSLISMFAETLEMDRVKSSEKKKEYYSIIRKETERLSGIVNGILSFSQIDANKRTYRFELLNLNEICTEVMSSYSFQLKDKGYTYQMNLSDHLKGFEGDRASVTEALINLVDNAIKYSREQKEIVIRTGQSNQNIFVEVKDYGMGIAAKYHKDVFGQFFRTPTNNVHNTKGSGLGLAIVQRIMEAHHGEIELESEIEKGSTFRLVFPFMKL